MRALCGEFARATGNAVDVQLDVNPEVVRRGKAGEAFDVAVGNPSTIEQLIAAGKVVPGSRRDIGHAGLAVAVRAGAANPILPRSRPSSARSSPPRQLRFPAHGASGLYFVGLLDRLGIECKMQGKLKPMAAEDCVEVVARGEADFVVVVATRIIGVSGVEVVGPIPEELQTKIGFAAGLSAATTRAGRRQGADRTFSSTPAAAATLRPTALRRRIDSCAFRRSCHRPPDSRMLDTQRARPGPVEGAPAFMEGSMAKFVRAFAGLLLAGGLATAASAQTKWDMPTPYPDGNFHTRNVAMFAADVAKATNGSLTITVHSAGSLYQACRDQARRPPGHRADRRDAGIARRQRGAGLRHRSRCPSSPLATSARMKLYQAQKPYLEKQLASEGLILLYSVPWPPQGIYAKREIKSVAELKGSNSAPTTP